MDDQCTEMNVNKLDAVESTCEPARMKYAICSIWWNPSVKTYSITTMLELLLY